MAKIKPGQMGSILNNLRRTFTFAFPAAGNEPELEAVKNIWLDHFGKYDHKTILAAAKMLQATQERPTISAMQDIIYEHLDIIPSVGSIRRQITDAMSHAKKIHPVAQAVADQAGGVYYLKRLDTRDAQIAIQTLINTVRETAKHDALMAGK